MIKSLIRIAVAIERVAAAIENFNIKQSSETKIRTSEDLIVEHSCPSDELMQDFNPRIYFDEKVRKFKKDHEGPFVASVIGNEKYLTCEECLTAIQTNTHSEYTRAECLKWSNPIEPNTPPIVGKFYTTHEIYNDRGLREAFNKRESEFRAIHKGPFRGDTVFDGKEIVSFFDPKSSEYFRYVTCDKCKRSMNMNVYYEYTGICDP